MESFKELIASGVCISCNTIEKCNYLSAKLDKLGYRWSNNASYVDLCYFEQIGKAMCYYPRGGQAASIDYWKKTMNKKVVTLESIFPKWDLYMYNNQINKILTS